MLFYFILVLTLGPKSNYLVVFIRTQNGCGRPGMYEYAERLWYTILVSGIPWS